jgi:hypothetical protein
MSDDKREIRKPPPMDNEKFDDWWRSLGDNDLDEFEQEIEASLKDYEILPDPNWEEKKATYPGNGPPRPGQRVPGRIDRRAAEAIPPWPARVLARRGGDAL